MMLEIVPGIPDRETFDRLFDEAWEKISAERQRVGDRELRESLWHGLHRGHCYMYVVDGYVAGCGSHEDIQIGEEKWLWYRTPTLGRDQTGSKAWFYSEDFQRIPAEMRKAEGYIGMIIVANTDSPAKAAVESHYGTFNAHFELPEQVDASSVFDEEAAENLGFATVYKIRYR